MNFENLSATKLLELLKNGSITSEALVNYYCDQIEKLNKEYNVYLSVVTREKLIEEAKKADIERQNGSGKKLLGIPFSTKDSYMTQGTVTTAGDLYLKDSLSEYTATIVRKLLEEGAILIGKVNMDSWGFGSSTQNSSYEVTKNPFDTSRVAGGSSGGSGASVALDMCAFSIGEDTGGSVRNPASYCGVYAFKPTYGRISRFGCIAYASSLDTVGALTKSAEDLELIFDILKGSDENDMTVENYELRESNYELKKKFAYSNDFMPDGISDEVKEIYLKSIEDFKAKGYEAVEVSFSTFKYCIPTYYITAMSEASTNLSRYHGTRYGDYQASLNNPDSTNKPQTWEDLFIQSRTKGFNKEAKRRVFLGAYVLSEGYYDAYYKKAQRIRNLIYKEISQVLKDVDFILSPVTPTPAPKIGEGSNNTLEEYLGDIYTVTANLAAIPAVAFPAGKSKDGLPIGMQIMGEKGSDEKLIKILQEIS